MKNPYNFSASHCTVPFILCLSFLLPVIIAVAGSFRAYDALPDQDLLWLSEALRLFRNAPPSYIDHPGAYWTLSYLAKLKLLSFRGVLEFISTRPGEAISPIDAGLIIKLSRIEQGVICGLCAIGLWPIWKALKTPKWLALGNTLSFAGSSGVLWESVRVRNESTSLLFFIIFVNLVISHYRHPARSKKVNTTKSILAVISALFSIYCKIQILILATFILPLLIPILNGENAIKKSIIRQITSNTKGSWLSIIAYSIVLALAWLAITSNWSYAPNPPFHHRQTLLNISFWVYINCLLIVTLSKSFFSRCTSSWRLSLLVVVFTEMMLGRILFHSKWTAQVFLTPASILGFSGESKEAIDSNLTRMIDSLSGYPAIFNMVLYIACIVLVLMLGNKKQSSTWLALSASGLIAVPGIWLTTVMRFKLHYGIYLSPITLILLTAMFVKSCPRIQSSSIRLFSGETVLSGLSIILIFGFWIGSAQAIMNARSYVNLEKTDRQICFSQHMDSLMRLTTAGKCANFETEKHI